MLLNIDKIPHGSLRGLGGAAGGAEKVVEAAGEARNEGSVSDYVFGFFDRKYVLVAPNSRFFLQVNFNTSFFAATKISETNCLTISNPILFFIYPGTEKLAPQTQSLSGVAAQ